MTTNPPAASTPSRVPADGAPAIEVQELRHAFPGAHGTVEVLDEVTLAVPPQSFVSVVGPSGCGKSTLLRILAGLLVPDAGTARIHGTSAVGTTGLAAFMPQRDLLLPWRRVLENATLGAEVAGLGRAAARERAAALLPLFGLAGFERAWPSQLSGGMRQRLALLRTFLHPAPVLLLDEPLGALDAITRRQMHGWLQDVWLADRRTVLLITHDVEEALLLSDTVLVMSPRPGKLVRRIGVPFPRPRRSDLISDPRFVALRADLLHALESV